MSPITGEERETVRRLLSEDREPISMEEARAALLFAGWCTRCATRRALSDSDRCGECEDGPATQGARE
jgi:hypothetical protein